MWCVPSPPITRAESEGRPNPDRNGLNRTETDEVTHLELGERIAIEPIANIKVVDPSERPPQAEFVVLFGDFHHFSGGFYWRTALTVRINTYADC